MSDCYVGCDRTLPIKLKVSPSTRAAIEGREARSQQSKAQQQWDDESEDDDDDDKGSKGGCGKGGRGVQRTLDLIATEKTDVTMGYIV